MSAEIMLYLRHIQADIRKSSEDRQKMQASLDDINAKLSKILAALESDSGDQNIQTCCELRETSAIPQFERREQKNGMVCYFFGNTCILVRETHENGKIKLDPVAGDQTACGEWIYLTDDQLHGYCMLLENHINRKHTDTTSKEEE